MYIEPIIAYLHYISFMVLFSTLITEHHNIKKETSVGTLRKIAVVDIVYVSAALIVLVTGILRLFYFGKGIDFYFKSGFFHLKLTLFTVVALISVYPAYFYYRVRQQTRNLDDNELIDIPRKVIMILRLELLGITVMPLLGVFMARGFWVFN